MSRPFSDMLEIVDGIKVDKDFQRQILRENIIHHVLQFQRYANMGVVDRNCAVVSILEEILAESKKMQLIDSFLDTENINE